MISENFEFQVISERTLWIINFTCCLKKDFYIKIIENLIEKNTFMHFLSCRRNQNQRINFLVIWCPVIKNYFCYLFIASRVLLQGHAKLISLLQRNFLACHCYFDCKINWNTVETSMNWLENQPKDCYYLPVLFTTW